MTDQLVELVALAASGTDFEPQWQALTSRCQQFYQQVEQDYGSVSQWPDLRL